MSVSWDAARKPFGSLLEAVGRTPLVRLSRFAPTGLELLGKVEWYGPTGSVKDRIYRAMLEAAEERGDLRPGMTVIECTTGNAGIACAAASAIKGYDCTIVMPEGMSRERKLMIAAYGAELVLTPGAGTDIELAFDRMREIVAADPDRYFFPAEFENADNPAAQSVSGEELWEQTGGELDAVVAAQGTGGWISGVASVLKARDPRIRVYVVEPAECPLLSEERWGLHGVPGISDGIVPANLDVDLLDGIVTIPTERGLETARALARTEGLLCGPSSGLNVAAALRVAAEHPELSRIATAICDTGQRYLSGELFGDRPEVEIPEREHRIDPAILQRLRARRGQIELLA